MKHIRYSQASLLIHSDLQIFKNQLNRQCWAELVTLKVIKSQIFFFLYLTTIKSIFISYEYDLLTINKSGLKKIIISFT